MLERLMGVLGEFVAADGADRSATALKLLQAMREPAKGMGEAGAEVIPGQEPANHVEVAKDVWRAMIDEALDGDFAAHPSGADQAHSHERSRDERDDWPL